MAEETKDVQTTESTEKEPVKEEAAKAEPVKAKSDEVQKNVSEMPKTEPVKADNADNSEVEQLKEQLLQAEIRNIGLIQAISLGVDSKTAEAVLKLADLSTVKDKNGKINADSVKSAVSKVLEEFPQLKPSDKQNGFVIGGNGNSSQTSVSKSKTDTVPLKRWNRFN